MTTHDDDGEASNGANETHQPDRMTRSKQRDDGNHAASRRYRHGSNEQHPRGETPRHAHSPATASNMTQRPRQKTANAPPHLSNERGAERYDDRARNG